jgi:hypothetical protein
MLKGFRFLMSDSYVVFVNGLSSLREIDTIDEEIKIAARRAVSRTLDKTRTAASSRMRDQVNWQKQYVDDKLSKYVKNDGMEGVIRATFRPTSLARFVVGAKTPWQPVNRVQVSKDMPNMARNRRMIIVPLRRGNAKPTEDNMNLGLAIRLKQGETVSGKYKMRELSKGLYLLYGPSISQVFYTVSDDLRPDAEQWLRDEYERQIKLLGTK